MRIVAGLLLAVAAWAVALIVVAVCAVALGLFPPCQCASSLESVHSILADSEPHHGSTP